MDENVRESPLIDLTNINEKVYDYIKKKIITSDFPCGHKLNIAKLSETLYVSQTPIKDALSRLSGEGLVDIMSRTGTYVKNLTQTDVYEILQIRLFLETSVISEVARKITDEQVQYIKDIYLKGISVAVTSDNSESYKIYMEHDSQFHLSLFNIMGNKRLLQIYQNLNVHMQIVRLRLIFHTMNKIRIMQTNEEHRMILDALMKRDVTNAIQAVEKHINRVISDFQEKT